MMLGIYEDTGNLTFPPTAAARKGIQPTVNPTVEGVKRAIPKIDIALSKIKLPGISLPRFDLGSIVPALKYLGLIIVLIIVGYVGVKVIAPRAKSVVKMVGKMDLMKEDLVSSYSRAIGLLMGTRRNIFKRVSSILK
jgi:hypothetical protein